MNTPHHQNPEIKILFICLGNICRSPAAEAVFKRLVNRKGMSDRFEIDSAGLISVHEGEKSDPRMISRAHARGIEMTSISRPIQPRDFTRFDYIVGMDDSNMEKLEEIRNSLPEDSEEKAQLRKFSDFCIVHECDMVPDPYFGGYEGFEYALDLIEDAAEGFYEFLRKEHSV